MMSEQKQQEESGPSSSRALSVHESRAVANQITGPMKDWSEGAVFDRLKHLATTFAQSTLVPKAFQNKPGDCFIALQMANRMGADPFLVLQNLNPINGKPALAAPFVIGMANERGPFSADISMRVADLGEITITRSIDDGWENGKKKFKRSQVKAQNLKVTAFAPLKSSGEVVSASMTLEMAELEGWTQNIKYHTMPEQMLFYRAAMMLVRRHCPNIVLGMKTADEVEDIDLSSRVASAGDASVAPAQSPIDKINSRVREGKKHPPPEQMAPPAGKEEVSEPSSSDQGEEVI